MRDRLRDDSGAVAVIVAIMIFVFAGLAVFAVDVGYWYNVKRQLQAAADAAALAGTQELILEKTDAEVWDTVVEYVGLNAVTPADTTITVVPPSAGGLSDIGVDFVKVTVEQTTRGFFAGIFGVDQTPIMAQARAVIAYALDGRYLVPFSVPIVIMGPDAGVTLRIGGTETELDPEPGPDPDSFEGDAAFSASPPADGAVSLPVDVDVYNSLGVLAEQVEDAARVLVRGADFPITEVWFSDDWVQPGDDVYMYVRTFDAAAEPTGEIDGPNLKNPDRALDFSAVGTGLWRAPFTVPATTERYARYAAQVSVEYEGTEYQVEDASKQPIAILMARRANAPIDSLEISPLVRTGGGSSTTAATVTFNRYQVSDETEKHEYEMKFLEGEAAETGNFGMVDFGKVSLAPNPPIDEVKGYDDGQHWKDQIEDGFLGVLHVDDLVRPWSGNARAVVGPNGPLTKRVGRSDMHFDEWLAAGRPADPRLVYVPIIEQYTDEIDGTSGWFQIVAFGAFFVDSDVDELKTSDAVRGYFVEYVAPSGSAGGDPGPTELDNLTPRLVSEDVDF